MNVGVKEKESKNVRGVHEYNFCTRISHRFVLDEIIGTRNPDSQSGTVRIPLFDDGQITEIEKRIKGKINCNRVDFSDVVVDGISMVRYTNKFPAPLGFNIAGLDVERSVHGIRKPFLGLMEGYCSSKVETPMFDNTFERCVELDESHHYLFQKENWMNGCVDLGESGWVVPDYHPAIKFMVKTRGREYVNNYLMFENRYRLTSTTFWKIYENHSNTVNLRVPRLDFRSASVEIQPYRWDDFESIEDYFIFGERVDVSDIMKKSFKLSMVLSLKAKFFVF